MDFTKILKSMSGMKCPTHGETFKITKTGNDPHFETCCESFGKKVTEELNKKIQVEAINQLKNSFKR